MARRTEAICGSLVAALIFAFIMFSGCSDNVMQTPLAGDLPGTETGLMGGGGNETMGSGLSKRLDGIPDIGVVVAREGEMLSAADIQLEYDEDDLPPGVELRAVFVDPAHYEFFIVPPGHARDVEIEVKIDLSRADITEEDAREGNLKVFGLNPREATPIQSDVEFDDMRVEFDTTTDFARYALARD